MFGEPPVVWISYILMRDVFHCTPNALRQQPLAAVQSVLMCMDVAARVEESRNRKPTIGEGYD